MNYKDQGVIGGTAAIQEWLTAKQDVITPEQVEEILNGILFYKDQFNKMSKDVDPFSALVSMYGAIDADMVNNEAAVIAAGEKTSCAKGCAHCCRINVDVTAIEADLLVEHCRTEGIPIDIRHLSAQLDVTKEERMFMPERNCVFLDETDSCKVYEFRPLACRKYAVVSPPHLCNAMQYPHGKVAQYMALQTELIASGIYNASEMGSMAEMLLESIKKYEDGNQTNTNNGG